MTNKVATKRYARLGIPAMIAYLAAIFGASFSIDDGDPVTLLTFIIALMPAVFVFLFMWAGARYIMELDEFMRSLQIRAIMWGLTLTTAITTAWGLLEFYTPVPRLPIFYVLPGFYLLYGLASVIVHKRHNAGCAVA